MKNSSYFHYSKIVCLLHYLIVRTIDPRSTTAPKELCESGDVNLDGQTTIADAVAILQYIGNRDKYQLTDQGKKNADVDGVKGITPNDALAIMKWDSFENR